MSERAATTFSQAISHAPVRAFQWATLVLCMIVLISDGIDMQLLGIVAPLVIADFGVDRSTFGIAMSAALIGFGLGSWSGGWLGDRVGRRYGLALAALIFSIATVAASSADGVWAMALWRVIGGLGFGAAYANALAMAGEWMPERLRHVTVSTISVGTPLGGTVVGWLGPRLAELYDWRGTFVIFGLSTSLLVVVILALLRDSPSFLLSRSKVDAAACSARRVLAENVPLIAEQHDDSAGRAIGVLNMMNLRLNIGVGIAFTASTLVAYAILNWSTTFLTAAGFTLAQAGYAVSIAGITSMLGSVAAGLISRRLGTRRVMQLLSISLLLTLVALAISIETLPSAPLAGERALVVALTGLAAALFSASIGTMYVIMTFGYPPSCRSAGLGFGIFMSRVGAIASSGLGGALLEFGAGSVIPFFAVLVVGAALIALASLVVDRHVPPLKVVNARYQ